MLRTDLTLTSWNSDMFKRGQNNLVSEGGAKVFVRVGRVTVSDLCDITEGRLAYLGAHLNYSLDASGML